jgi:hypothetical protein
MKKILAIASALLVLGALVPAFGATVTNADGTTFTINTLEETAAAGRVATIVEDQSRLPDQNNRRGYVLAKYDVAVDGGTGAIEIGPALPDNVAVLGGYAQVVTAILPATATNALHIVNANDLLTAGTSLQSTGFKALNQASASYVTPDSVTNTVLSLKAPIQTASATEKVTLTLTGSTATQGVVYVWLDLVQMQ